MVLSLLLGLLIVFLRQNWPFRSGHGIVYLGKSSGFLLLLTDTHGFLKNVHCNHSKIPDKQTYFINLFLGTL